MKIAIQAADLDWARIDGTRVYILNLLKYFGQIDQKSQFIIYHKNNFNPELTPENFPNYKIWKQQNGQTMVENQLREVDAVTTTTEFLASKIREINPNVIVCPNAVNLKEQQWTYNKKISNKVRFLWGGGITHEVDLRLLKTSIESLDKEILNNQ